ncbi:MAG: hypothetical protein K2L96_01720 [Muribaculaceae bacterium]|nr:hypothetical protein [Muribaculaceae bacterium]
MSEKKDKTILKRACEAWTGAADFRFRRERCKRFTYGDQWGDECVSHYRGVRLTDGERLARQGRTPLTNNLIRQLVKTIIGRFRTQASEQGEYKDAMSRRNALGELDSRMLEEFLISGAAIQRLSNECREGGTGVWVDNVDPRRFFVNVFQDPRGTDIELVGMLHDMGLPELVSRYGHGSAERCGFLEQVFADCVSAGAYAPEKALGMPAAGSEDFFLPGDSAKMRVIEVWTLDASRREGGTYSFGWRCRVFAADGRRIDSFASPYRGGGHPFVVKFYPMTDGEVHSFVEGLIENQKYINRLISIADHIMASSAKGALLFPINELPDNVRLDEVAQRWASPDAVIPLREGKVLPQQVATRGSADGACQLLTLQMKLFENSTGVSDVLMGRNVSAAVGKDNYRARVETASIALADLLDTFGSFLELRDRKAGIIAILQNKLQ